MIENVGERGAHFVAFQEYQNVKKSKVVKAAAGETSNSSPTNTAGDCHMCNQLCSKTNAVGVAVAAVMAITAVLLRRDR
jgi:hypothetical protein